MELFQANDILFAIVLPRGSTTISVRYELETFKIGAMLSLTAHLALLAIIIWRGKGYVRKALALVRRNRVSHLFGHEILLESISQYKRNGSKM